MASHVSGRRPGGRFLGFLRATAPLAVPVGAMGSVGLTLYAGRHAPRLLIVLFAIWVLSPFIAPALANVVSKRWSALTRAALDGVMIVVALGSLAAYGADVLNPPKAQAAFVFVVVPAASWLLIATVVVAAALISGWRSRRSRRDDGA